MVVILREALASDKWSYHHHSWGEFLCICHSVRGITVIIIIICFIYKGTSLSHLPYFVYCIHHHHCLSFWLRPNMSVQPEGEPDMWALVEKSGACQSSCQDRSRDHSQPVLGGFVKYMEIAHIIYIGKWTGGVDWILQEWCWLPDVDSASNLHLLKEEFRCRDGVCTVREGGQP